MDVNKINHIAHFSFTHKKLYKRRDQPWQVRHQMKAHNPGKSLGQGCPTRGPQCGPPGV